MTFQYPIWLEIIVSALLLLGSVFVTIGALALFRNPDFFTRLPGPPQATTLGMFSLLAASVIYFNLGLGWFSIHDMLIMGFLFLSGPITGYVLAKAAVLQQLRVAKKTKGKPMEQ